MLSAYDQLMVRLKQMKNEEKNQEKISFFLEYVPFLNHFISHPNLVYNFDYMDDFIQFDTSMRQFCSDETYLIYRKAYQILVNAYDQYQHYYLKFDNKDGCLLSLPQLHECMRAYKVEHVFQAKDLIAILEPIFKAINKELI